MKTILRVLAFAMLCLASPAWAATLIAKDQAGLTAALAAAQTGDTIKVVGVVPAPRLTPKPGLTFDMTEAVAVEWRLGYWTDVTFVGGTYRATAANRSGLEISGKGITFANPRAEGPGVKDGVTGEGYGLSFLGSATAPVTGVKVIGGHFDGLMAGVRVSLGRDVVVEGSTFTRIRADGITFSGVDGFRVISNDFRDFLPDGLKHPDAFQTNRPLNGVPVTRNGLVKGNRATGHIQAYFVPDTVDVTLEGNYSKVSAATGIGVSGTTRATLKDNVMETLEPSDTISRIDTREAVGLKFEGYNVARAFGRHPAVIYSGVDPATAPTELDRTRAALQASEAARAALEAWKAGVVEAVSR